MSSASSTRLVAVDIGNSRIKIGEFAAIEPGVLPVPTTTAAIDVASGVDALAKRLSAGVAECQWAIASVNRPAATRLTKWLVGQGATSVKLLALADMPVKIDVDRSDSVGLDRLADVTAANCLRTAGQPAVVVDHGSAITVNLIAADGTFQGGAILPGVNMSARALHEFTDGLPLVDIRNVPDELRRSTEGAIAFGIAWGAVGAVREVIARLLPSADAYQVFVTGGGGEALANLLDGDGPKAQYVPHLTLSGVALAAARLTAGDGR